MMSDSINSSRIMSVTTSGTQSSGVMRGYDDGQKSSASDLNVATLGKNDFLKLLLTELQHQDPLNPADNTEFIAQLAQFSSLEQLTSMNEGLAENIDANRQMSESINNAMMVNFFGREVAVESGGFMFDGETPVTLNFDLADNAARGKIEITDSSGTIVANLMLDSLNAGIQEHTWDGLTDLGVYGRSGQYSYEVKAFDYADGEIEATPVFTGIVEGVSYKDGKTQLDVGGIMVPFEKVEHITYE